MSRQASFANSLFSGILCILVGYSAFSLGDGLAKYAGTANSTITTLFFINIFSVFILALISPKIGGLPQVWRTIKLAQHIVRGILFAAGMFLFIYAVQHIQWAKAATILFTMPFISSILAVALLKEKAPWRRWLAIIIGFAGVLTVLRPGLITPDLPAFGVLLAALLFSIFDIMSRKIGATEPWINFAFFPAVIMVVTFGTWRMFHPSVLPDAHWLVLFAIAAVFYVAGSLLTARGYTLTPIAIASPFQYIQLIWAVALGFYAFHERPDAYTYAGIALVVGSGLILIYQTFKARAVTAWQS